jgi:hypothetical protein
MPKKINNSRIIDQLDLAIEILKFITLLNAGGVLILVYLLAGAAQNDELFFIALANHYEGALITFTIGLFSALSILYINIWLNGDGLFSGPKWAIFLTKAIFIFPAIFFFLGVAKSIEQQHIYADRFISSATKRVHDQSQQIEELKKEMGRVLKNSDLINKDLKDISNSLKN